MITLQLAEISCLKLKLTRLVHITCLLQGSDGEHLMAPTTPKLAES